MLCLDPELRTWAPWEPGTHVLAVVGYTLAVARADEPHPVIVHVAKAADELALASRLWPAAARYDVRRVYCLPRMSPRHLQAPLRAQEEHPDSGVRAFAPEFDVSDLETYAAVLLAATVAARYPSHREIVRRQSVAAEWRARLRVVW